MLYFFNNLILDSICFVWPPPILITTGIFFLAIFSIKERFPRSKEAILIISTPWQEFYDIDIKLLKQSKLEYIIDPYRVLFHYKKNLKCKYYCLGKK